MFPAPEKDKIEKFLNEEEAKLERADYLTEKMNSYRFGVLDPRWWKCKNELHKVVDSFKLGTYEQTNYL